MIDIHKPTSLFRLATGHQQSVPLTNIPGMVQRAYMVNGRRATEVHIKHKWTATGWAAKGVLCVGSASTLNNFPQNSALGTG